MTNLSDLSDINIITVILISMVVGFFIPHFARRFSKIMPCVPPNMFVEMFRMPHYMFLGSKQKGRFSKGDSPEKTKRCKRWLRLRSKVFWGSGVMSLLMACMSLLMLYMFEEPTSYWFIGFLLTSFLLSVIDVRYELLPDVLTVPLIMIGFAFSVWGGGWISPHESVFGAIAGYLLPTFVGVIMYWRNTYAFGGGDFKMLAAMGAWLGFGRLNVAIFISVLLFAIYAIAKKKSQGPYGLAITIGALLALLIPENIIAFLYN